MKDLSANSYDLLEAQEMLSRLHALRRGAKAELQPQATTSKYLDLSLSVLPQRAPVIAVAEKRGESPSDEPDNAIKEFDTWENIIIWCISLAKAEAGFVVDSQGFVIASRGRLPAQGIEGVGAELVCSIEQLERIDPDAGKLQSVEMEFDKKRLIGFVAGTDEKDCYVIGLIAPDSLNFPVKQKIMQQIFHNLPNLD